MRWHTKVFLAVGLLSGMSAAQAVPMINISLEGLAAAQSAEATFIGGLSGDIVTEDFEDKQYTVGDQMTPFTSTVGTFTVDKFGKGGLCDYKSFACDAGLAVLDEDTSPFNGRFNTTEGGSNWLDSMDARKMTFVPIEGTTALGFYLTDPNDAGGVFDLTAVGNSGKDSRVNIFDGSLPTGRVFYISVEDPLGITSLSINTNNPNDGYGVDDVTVAVPAPGTLALLGFGLAMLGMLRRRQT